MCNVRYTTEILGLVASEKSMRCPKKENVKKTRETGKLLNIEKNDTEQASMQKYKEN